MVEPAAIPYTAWKERTLDIISAIASMLWSLLGEERQPIPASYQKTQGIQNRNYYWRKKNNTNDERRLKVGTRKAKPDIEDAMANAAICNQPTPERWSRDDWPHKLSVAAVVSSVTSASRYSEWPMPFIAIFITKSPQQWDVCDDKWVLCHKLSWLSFQNEGTVCFQHT